MRAGTAVSPYARHLYVGVHLLVEALASQDLLEVLRIEADRFGDFSQDRCVADILALLPVGAHSGDVKRRPLALRQGVLLQHQGWSASGAERPRIHVQAVLLARASLQQWPSGDDTPLTFR